MLYKRKSILLVCSRLTGGTKRHFGEMINAWVKQGHYVIVLEVYYTLAKLCVLFDKSKSVSAIISLPMDRNVLLHILEKCDIAAIHYHHFLRMDFFWLEISKLLKVPFYVTLHDYYTICPLIKLSGKRDKYCELPNDKKCNDCLKCKKNQLQIDMKMEIDDIKKWRDKWNEFLLQAKKVFVPHGDVKRRLAKVLPELETTVFENPEIVPLSVTYGKKAKANKKIHIGIIGALEKTKGAGVILAVAEEIVRRDLPIELILFGRFLGYRNNIPRSLTVLGNYTEERVYQQIVDNAIDFFIFPPLVPETYSYTLSIPIKLGIPVLGVNIGAIGARIQEHVWGEVYPYDSNAEYICNRLMTFDYKYYANKKENFKIVNNSFPLAKDLYGNRVDKKAEMNSAEIAEFISSLNKRVEYIGMTNVIASDFLVLKSWGGSWRAVEQMFLNVKWSWFFLQIGRKIHRYIRRR